MTAAGALPSALRALSEALAETGQPAAIIGGIAAVARGVDRHTRDIDATVRGGELSLEVVLKVLARHGLVPRVAAALHHAERHHVLLLVHEESGTDVDLSFAFLPFEQEAIAEATEIDFAGVTIRVVRAEDLVIYKSVAWRPVDRTDVERLLELWGERIDLARVRSWIRQFAEILDDPRRLDEFEEVVSRARGA